MPAASQPDQAVALAQHLDCILVVTESEKTQTIAVDRLLNRLSQSDTQILGVVLTKTRSYLPKFIRSFVGSQV
jgi:Mrp family chromosome partitioning ATPase